MHPFTTIDPITTARRRTGETCLTEEEAEWLDYRKTGGKTGEPFEKEAVFGLLGIGSALLLALFGWILFKKIWFVWLGMPGWW